MANLMQKIINSREAWDTALSQFRNVRLIDIYFEFDYHMLHVMDSERVEAFLWQEGQNTFFLPFVVRPIPSQIGARQLFDFETVYGYSGPLSSTEESSFLNRAWEGFVRYCRENQIINGFIRFHPLLSNSRFVSPSHVRLIHDRQTVTVDLEQSDEQLLQSYRGDIMYQVARSVKNGISIEQLSGIQNLLIFADVYEERMRELKAAPEYYFGRTYFESIDALGRNTYSVFLARKDGQVIGGLLALLSNRFAHYHLACSLKKDLIFAPNKLLLHAFLSSQLRHSTRRLVHLGGGRTNDANDALFKFKCRFSPLRSEFYLGHFIVDSKAHEALCESWDQEHPELAERYGKFLQRYRLSQSRIESQI